MRARIASRFGSRSANVASAASGALVAAVPAALAVALTAMGAACIPHPSADFEDYQEAIKDSKAPVVDAAVFDAAPPPTEAVEGIYYGACLTELALSQIDKVFNFYTVTKFTPEAAGGGRLTLTLLPLKVESGKPPAVFSKAGGVGAEIATPAATAPNVTAAGKFTISLATVAVPGAANPISGSDAEIIGPGLQGNFSQAQFCARLSGQVTKPAAAARTLTPEGNICQFRPVKDGDPTPKFTLADFQAASCPL